MDKETKGQRICNFAAKKRKNDGSVSGGSSFSSIRTIFMHAEGADWLMMTIGFLGAIGDGLSTPFMLYFSSKLMNTIGSASSSKDMFSYNLSKGALSLTYLACVQWAACFLEGFFWTRTGELQASRMRYKYLKALLRQEVAYFDLSTTTINEIVNSVSNDSLVLQDVLSEKVPNFVMNVSLFIGSYIFGFSLMWKLAITALPFTIFLVIPGLLYGRILMELSSKTREEYVKAGSIAEQALSSIRTVYAFVGEKKTTAEFSAAMQKSVKLGLHQGLAKGLAIGSNGIVFAIWAFMCYVGSRLVMYHGVNGGTVFAVAASIAVGGLSLGSALSNVKYFSEASSAGERIEEILRRSPRIDIDNAGGTTLEVVRGEVEFRHVRFAYPSRPETMVLCDFCLKIATGKTVALVGSSGSGKSTTIALLQRFYDPLEGEILLDGISIDKLPLKWLRKNMGLVSQEPTLFGTSIKENILFGKENASMEEVTEAAKASNAHDFISKLPQGYETQVGERGVQMSGGQKQRIAIARAIIKAPKILLLDEATSALDSESECAVQKALDGAAEGRTTITIAHRLSTIGNADEIAVVESGRVVETGSHVELLEKKDSAYASLVNLLKTDTTPEYSTTNMLQQQRPSSSSTDSFAPSSSISGRKTEQEDNTPVPSFRRLLALNLPEWKQAIHGCIAAILFGAVQPVYAFSLGSMVSVFFLTDHEEIKKKTKIYSLSFLGLAIASMIINIVQHYNFAYMGELLTKRIREKMLSKMLTFEVGWFDRDENSSGAICSRLAKDANVVRSLVGDRMALLVQTCSAVFIAGTMGLVVAWRISIVMIAAQPLIIICFYTRRVLLKSLLKQAGKAQEESSKVVAEAVSNFRTLTAFSSQGRILKIFEETQADPHRKNMKQAVYAGLGLAASQSLMSCTWALDFWYGGRLIAGGYITTKSLFEAFFMLVSTGRVIADAGSMTSDLAKGADSVASVFAILDRSTTIEPEDPAGYKPERLTGQVELREVEFAYPARPETMVFRKFSITIDAGKSTALVGQSGSGKSTILGLIERFYDPQKGMVMIDGKNIKAYHLRSLRKHIALVSQEPTLFSGTIRENILYGGREIADESEIIEAAKVANADGFITGLRDGYDTMCGDRGVQLSGGQKQRVAIARAVLRNPAILLLDEATSALDTQSEKVVQNALERLMIGRTSVVVAHRLSSIQNCDLIAVLENGEVVEKGTHSSLMALGTSGTYHSMVNLQSMNS